MATYLIDGGAHIDIPLTNLAIMAFESTGEYVGPQLFPAVNVARQSDGYYVIDPDSWLRVPDTTRAPKQSVKRAEWKVSTDTYFCKNFAFADELAKEDLSNADIAVQLRENSIRFVGDVLLRDKEKRIADLVTSISNVGSGVILSGGNKWSDYVGSDPVSDVSSGHVFIENRTGLKANMMIMDKDTYRSVRHHPVVREYAKNSDGTVPDSMLKELFEVDTLLVARGIYNPGKESGTASRTNIWGNNVVLARVQAGTSLQTQTFGLSMQWQPEGFGAPMVVQRYDHHDRSRHCEVLEAQYFADYKVVARELSYVISSTL